MFQTAEIPFASTFPRRMFDIRRAIRSLLQNREAQVVTLRIVLGFGWLMAGVEKMSDPAWHSGDTLTLFLHNQIGVNAVYFPFYEMLITELFLPNVVLLSWIVLMGEWLVGMALITGTLTNVALFFGVLMNVNYIMAGVIDPSILYIVIQGILYSSQAGATFSLDSVFSGYFRTFLGHDQQNGSQGHTYRQGAKQQQKQQEQSNRSASARTRGGSNADKKAAPNEDIFMGGSMKDSTLRNRV